MDDGQEAVVDAFLYFSNEKWATCDVTFAHNRDGWKVIRLSLREIDWAIEPFSPTGHRCHPEVSRWRSRDGTVTPTQSWRAVCSKYRGRPGLLRRLR